MKLQTKQEFQDWMMGVLEPLIPFYSEGKARLFLGDTKAVYPQDSIELEAFSRPLWALVPFWRGGGKGFEKSIRKGWDMERIRLMRNIGAGFKIMISVLWKWRRLPAG